LIFLCL